MHIDVCYYKIYTLNICLTIKMDPIWLANAIFTNMTADTQFELEALPFKYQILLIILYTITSIIAFFVNFVTVLVLIRGEKTSKELKKYLINLSCADLIMATFSIPFTYTMFMYGKWIFIPEFCPFVMSLQLWSLFVSVYTLTAIGIDR